MRSVQEELAKTADLPGRQRESCCWDRYRKVFMDNGLSVIEDTDLQLGEVVPDDLQCFD